MMVRFIFKLIFFSILLLLVCIFALRLNPNYEKEYIAAVTLKTSKLKQTTKNKIVIIGGSNASFGIDSELLEEELGLPVVNMALHGGLPLKYIIEQVKTELKPGDILILSKEYSGLTNQYWNKMSGVEIPKITTYGVSQFIPILSDRKLFESSVSGVFKTIKHYLKSYPITFKKDSSVYSYDAFKFDNIKEEFLFGDYKKKVEKHSLPKLRKGMNFLSELKDYKEYFEKKDIKFYLTPPVIIEGYYDDEKIIPFWNKLSKISQIPLLNESKSYTYQRQYFFNSHYHPNTHGRMVRTQSLLSDIQNKLEINTFKNSNKLFVADSINLNLANLEMVDKSLNFNVIRRSSNQINIKPIKDLSNNYFRIRFKKKNLNGYNFYMKLKCSQEVFEKLRFRGVGKAQKFDKVILSEGNIYEVWKNVDKVYYSDSNSYLGIMLLNDKLSKNDELTIKDVGVFKNKNPIDKIASEYIVDKQSTYNFFKIISDSDKLRIKEIIHDSDSQVKLHSNKPYEIKHTKNKIHIIDFYNGNVLYTSEKQIRIKSNKSHSVKFF